mgnify:CR=1 FL=1
MGKLKVVVLYDRWEEPEAEGAPDDKAPITRTLDKKEVEEEVADDLRVADTSLTELRIEVVRSVSTVTAASRRGSRTTFATRSPR